MRAISGRKPASPIRRDPLAAPKKARERPVPLPSNEGAAAGVQRIAHRVVRAVDRDDLRRVKIDADARRPLHARHRHGEDLMRAAPVHVWCSRGQDGKLAETYAVSASSPARRADGRRAGLAGRPVIPGELVAATVRCACAGTVARRVNLEARRHRGQSLWCGTCGPGILRTIHRSGLEGLHRKGTPRSAIASSRSGH